MTTGKGKNKLNGRRIKQTNDRACLILSIFLRTRSFFLSWETEKKRGRERERRAICFARDRKTRMAPLSTREFVADLSSGGFPRLIAPGFIAETLKSRRPRRNMIRWSFRSCYIFVAFRINTKYRVPKRDKSCTKIYTNLHDHYEVYLSQIRQPESESLTRICRVCAFAWKGWNSWTWIWIFNEDLSSSWYV